MSGHYEGVCTPDTMGCVLVHGSPRDIMWGEGVQKPLIFMRFHGVFLGKQHEIWSKQHNGKVSIFYPEHIVDNIVQPSAIALDDLRSRGFSVDRRQHAQQDIMQQNIANLRNRQQEARQVDYIARLQCRTVRDIQDSDAERAFIVIDTAYEINIAHASIYSAKP